MARKTGSHAQITGPRIREAALSLFARQGYAAVSMRKIAAEVGVQAGALYTYTPDKQALLFDLMRTHMADLLGAWAGEPKGSGPLARLESFVRFHIRYHIDRPDEVFIAYMELRNLAPENLAQIVEMRRLYEAELQSILKEGAAQGVFQIGDIKVASMALIAMLTGVNTWFRDGGRLDCAQVEQIYWDMALGSLGCDPGVAAHDRPPMVKAI